MARAQPKRKPELEQQFGERIRTLFTAAFAARAQFARDHHEEMMYGKPNSLTRYINAIISGNVLTIYPITKETCRQDLHRERMLTFLTLLAVPEDDPAMKILQQIDPDFIYPHQQDDDTPLEEKIGRLDIANRRYVNNVVNKLLEGHE